MKNISLPENLFSKIFAEILLPKESFNSRFVSSAMVLTDLIEDRSEIALIPSLDILQHRELFISGAAGIAFDGFFSNQFLYFKKNANNLDELHLRGDISKNDIILSKILFAEKYESEVSLVIDTKEIDPGNKNYLIAGEENFAGERFKQGISFCDQVCDLLDAPYVNYIVVSKQKEIIEEFNQFVKDADKKLEDKFNLIEDDINPKLAEQVKGSINSIYFELTPVEHDSMVEMVRLCFYQGIVEELFELNIV